MAREKDTRKIVRGVQFFEDPAVAGEQGTLETFTEGREDELEAVLTPEQCERLLAEGSLEGDWKPQGEPLPPMRGSRYHDAYQKDGHKGVEAMRRHEADVRAKRFGARAKAKERLEAERAKGAESAQAEQEKAIDQATAAAQKEHEQAAKAEQKAAHGHKGK